MSFIKAENLIYTYPVAEEMFDGSSESSVKNKQTEPAINEMQKDQLPALNNVSLEIEAGQFICILGRNGSGKSTLARHLNALLIPDAGTVWVRGMDTKNEDHLWEIRSSVGMVFQNPDNQIIGSVVDEDVAFGLENLGVPSEEIQARVKSVLEEVGMSGYAKHSPNNLSGGQKQRVAVAGILAMQPECIILDEATAMLDPKGREEVMNMALKLNKEKNITLISITHYMDEALNADMIYVMDEGKIVMSGTPKEIFCREEEICSLGLKLPQVCRLASDLRKAGMDIPEGILSQEELICALQK